MATNVSDDGSAPVDFNLSSTIYNSESKNSGERERCFLCNNLRKAFYCKICVGNGDFVSSKPQNPERYADKKLQWLKLKSDKVNLSKKCQKVFEKMEVKMRLQSEVNQCTGRIKLLVQLIKKKNEIIKKTNKDIETIKEKNLSRFFRLPRNKERIEKLELYVNHNMKAEIKQKRSKVIKAELELKKIVQKNVEDLISYIFPISKIDAISKNSEEIESTDTVSALAEATRTSYVRGKWVFMDSTGDLHYKIVAPTLPGSGDYSAYSDWVAANKNGVPGSEKMTENQAFSISAALCYTTQLVNLIAFYLDILLPNRLNYNDFCNTDISDNKFYKKISKLNTNILYLCFSQGVDTTLLNPKQTLCNLLHLVNYSDLGKSEPFEIDSNLVLSLENFGTESKTDECSEDEENDVPSEWEAIPLVPCPESSPGSTAFSTHQIPSLHATTSMANGLVTSLASMWKEPIRDAKNNLIENLDISFKNLSQDNLDTSLTFCGTNEFSLHETGNLSSVIPTETENSLSLFTPQYNLRCTKQKLNFLHQYSELQKITYKVKEWKVKKRRRKKQKIKKNKKTKLQKSFLTNTKENNNENKESYIVEDMCPFTKTFSQESVSLLKDCYEERLSEKDFPDLTETCINSQLELIDINVSGKSEAESNLTPDLELKDNLIKKKTNFFFLKDNKSSQTNFTIYNYEKQIKKQNKKKTNFIKSILSLKYILPQKDDSNKNLFNTLNILEEKTLAKTDKNNETYFLETNLSPIVSQKALKFSISNSNELFFKSVSNILNYLEISLLDNLEELAYFWKGSLYELAVNIVIKAGHSDFRVQKSIDSFLCKIIDSIHANEKSFKNLALESKATFVIIFCQSYYYSYNVISHIIEKIKTIKNNKQSENLTLKEKLSIARKGNNYYFLLQILQSLLESVKLKYEQEGIKIIKTVEKQNFDILVSWKKLWKQNDVEPKQTTFHYFSLFENKWCKELDEVLIYCVESLPVLAVALEKCGKLAKDIFNLSHEKAGGQEGLLKEYKNKY